MAFEGSNWAWKQERIPKFKTQSFVYHIALWDEFLIHSESISSNPVYWSFHFFETAVALLGVVLMGHHQPNNPTASKATVAQKFLG